MQSHFSKAQPGRNDAAAAVRAVARGIPPGCAAQLVNSLRCSVQSNGRSSSVRRVAVNATGCWPCKIQSTADDGVFNNLVMFDQHVAQNSMASIVPDLATSWSWNEEGTDLTLPLRQGVKWHDGKPFTARDVKCTWDLLTGRSAEKLRLNPRKTWYSNL
jgi:ABC-type transport system substrate-binding protein